MLILPVGSPVLCYITGACLGFFVVASLSLGLDFGCEVSHPVPPNNVTGVMISYSMMVSAMHILAANFIFEGKSSEDELAGLGGTGQANLMIIIMLLTMVVALIFAIIAKEDLRKKKIDDENKLSLMANQSDTENFNDLEP